MLNYLWAFMVLTGILWGAFHGTTDAVTQGALNSAKEAVSLCITMLGVMSLWTGILEIGQKAGLIEKIVKRMRPVLKFLFPYLPEGHPAGDAIATNMIANVLGLGWAATPAGLKAMEVLEELEEERRKGTGRAAGGRIKRDRGPVPRGTASNEMCTFLIINISSLQLVPVNIIAYRAQYGSVNPAAIVGAGIVATAVSTLIAVIYCKMMDGKRRV